MPLTASLIIVCGMEGGSVLFFAGLELGVAAREESGRNAFFAVVATAGGILAVNAAVGFLLGLGAALLLLRESPAPAE